MKSLCAAFALVLAGALQFGFSSPVAAQDERIGLNLFEMVHRKVRFVTAGSWAGLVSDIGKVDAAEILDFSTVYPVEQSDLVLFIVQNETELPELQNQFPVFSSVFEDIDGKLDEQVTILDLNVSGDDGPRMMRVYFLNISKLKKTVISTDCISRFVYASSIFHNARRMLDSIGCPEK
jgi:hypothetical protein